MRLVGSEIHAASSKRPVVACVAVFALVSASALASDDPSLTLACGFALALTIGLLWRLGEPPVLLLPAGLQLSQVVTPLFYANVLGVPLQTVSLHIGDMTTAIWFALGAMVSLVLGMWCGQLGARPAVASVILREARAWTPRSAFLFCLVLILIAAVFEVSADIYSGLRQIALAADGVQWLGVFVLTCVCMAQRRGFKYLLLVACLEIVRGFTGYFSDFKTVLFVILVGLFSARPKLGPRSVLAGLAVAMVLLLLGAWWSAIKKEYRTYVSMGSRQQVVLVPVEDRLAFLARKMFEANGATISQGFELLAQRWGYLDFLASTMRNVPSRLPFEDGARIGDAVMHVLQPRLLFPDKPPLLSDSDVLQKYTGIYYGQSSGADTSVSLGYVAELYIDFRAGGTIAAMFLLGLLVGLAFRWLCSSFAMPMLVNYGLAVMLTTSVTQFDQSLIKTAGAFVTTFLAVLILKRFLLPPLLKMMGPAGQQKIWQQAVARTS